MNTTITSDRRWSLLGTIIVHTTMVLLLMILMRNCNTGGGGGNGGLGYTGLMSMDAAGLGTFTDGLGYEPLPAAEEQPVTTNEPVEQDVSAISDDNSTAEAPVVNNKPKTDSPTNPKDKTPVNTKPKEQQVSGNLNNAFGSLSKGGNGNTTGGGQQGTADGSIDGKGVMSGGGSLGTGGGQGGGNGTGNGTGDGPGSGPGNGGGFQWELKGRSITRNPSITETAPDEGVVVVDIWVDKDGNVTKAVANPAKSTTTNGQLYKLAENSAKKAKFSAGAANEQKGSIKITFKLK